MANNRLEGAAPKDYPRAALGHFLSDLERERPERDATTLYLAAGQEPGLPSFPDFWHRPLAQVPEIRTLLPSETGLVLLLSPTQGYALVPPFPIEESKLLPGWDFGPLWTLLHRPHRYAAVLVRLGRYGVGIYEGDKLISSKTDQRYVHARHRAGGQSQRRFERRREEQARALYDEACQTVKEKLGPYEGWLEHIFLGGDRHTLNDFRARCPYLQRWGSLIRRRVLPVREPNHQALERLPHEVWKTRVIPLVTLVTE